MKSMVPSPGTVNMPARKESRKERLASLDSAIFSGRTSLKWDVLDAVDGAVQQAQDVAVAHESVTGVEQQGDLLGVSQLKQLEGFFLGLYTVPRWWW